MKRQTRKKCLLWPLLLGLLLGSWASAFEARSGNTVVVGPQETVTGDLYATGNRVLIRGTVAGDLFAAANTVNVTGTVTGDVMAAGQTVRVSGQVEDDVRTAAYTVSLEKGGEVGGDLVTSGYSLTTAPTTQIAGDLVFGGRQARLDGRVGGNARIGVAGLELGGTITGTLGAAVAGSGRSVVPPMNFGLPNVPAVADGLELTEGARVGGQLNLVAPTEIDVRPGVVTGKVTTRTERETERPFYFSLLNRFVVLLVGGLLLLWVAPGSLQRGTEALTHQPWASLGWGVVGLLGTPIALTLSLLLVFSLLVLLGLIALGGLAGLIGTVGLATLTVLVVLFALALWVFAPVVAGYSVGRLVVRSSDRSGSRFFILVIGILAVVLLTAIPWVGGVIGSLAVLLGLGALIVAWRSRLGQSTSRPTS